jgi:hypothetical protein
MTMITSAPKPGGPGKGTRRNAAVGLAAAVVLSGAGLSLAAPEAHAEPSNYNFDFGGGPVEPGYIGVSATDAYSPETRYGFNTPEHMADVPAKGTGAASDAVRFLEFGTKSTNTFNVTSRKACTRSRSHWATLHGPASRPKACSRP